MRRYFQITVEPVAFLSLFAASLLDPISQQYIYEKLLSDKPSLNLTTITNNTHSCINVTTSAQSLESKVQSEAAVWLLYLNIAAVIPAMFFSLLLGAWSDKAGRKMVLIVPSVGGIIQTVVYILVVYLGLPIPYLVIGNIAYGISGYVTTTVAACMAYIADITSKRHRTLRIVIVDCLIGFGSGLAGFVSGYWLRAQGFKVPFWLILACHICSILYVIIFLHETIARERGAPVLTCRYFIDMWKVFTKPSSHRWKLLIYVASFALIETAISGTDGLFVLYAMRWPFCFDYISVGYLSGAVSCGFITSLLGVKLLRMIPNFSNHWIIEIGLASNIGGLLLATFAKTKTMLFLVPVCEALAIMPLSVLRACMSKVVAQQEQGSMFAAVGCVESASLFIAYAMFNSIYSATMHYTIPGIIFLIGAAMLLMPAFLIWFVQCYQERYSYDVFVESVSPRYESSSESEDNPAAPMVTDGITNYSSCNRPLSR